MLQKVVVTFDRLSVHTLSRCVRTLDQGELDSQQAQIGSISDGIRSLLQLAFGSPHRLALPGVHFD